jgi:hypothetical protein
MGARSKMIGSVLLAEGLLGELQAEALIKELCSEGCPSCHNPLTREGRFKCYCSTCDIGLELAPPDGDQN